MLKHPHVTCSSNRKAHLGFLSSVANDQLTTILWLLADCSCVQVQKYHIT